CLSIRPERHLTSDGVTPLPAKQIGRRVTSKKARMWNDVYLGEVNFWRDYLSGGNPKVVLNFGDQSAVIDTEMLAFGVDWPGIPLYGPRSLGTRRHKRRSTSASSANVDGDVLYVGGNTGDSDRFITRVGDLIADMLGFWGEQTGHHSGGIRLWEYCHKNRIN